jgi:ABC-type glutathione transport system ATPase component
MMKYWMPDKKTRNPVECNSDCNSVIIIGGNGSGKSKLGAWIEQQDYSVTHRIAAQRSLVFDPNADLMAYDKAENIVISGYHEKRDDRNHKWDWNRRNTTRLISDFDASLAAIIAKKNDQLDEFNEKYKKAEKEGLDRPVSPWTQIDELRDIWERIFPQRKLLFKSSRFYAVNPGTPEDEKYSALEMSDGERGVLYLASQILSLDHGRIIIVDEPETHLHGSIMNNLWAALERARNDCQFVYITHDINFAARHTNSDK